MTVRRKNRWQPYLQLYKSVHAAAQEVGFKGDKFLMMAICIRSSMGVPWFCKCDSMYMQQMNLIRDRHGVQAANKFAGDVRVKTGEFRGMIPKFRYSDFGYAQLLKDRQISDMTQSEQIFCSLKLGLALKPAWGMYKTEDNDIRCLALSVFARDPKMQLATLAHDLSQLGATQGGLTAFGATLIMDGARSAGAVELAAQMNDLANELRVMYGHAPLNLNEVSMKNGA